MAKKKNSGANLGFESQLWPAADKPRNNAEAVKNRDEPFDEKNKRLTATLKVRRREAARVDKAIWSNLKGLGYD